MAKRSWTPDERLRPQGRPRLSAWRRALPYTIALLSLARATGAVASPANEMATVPLRPETKIGSIEWSGAHRVEEAELARHVLSAAASWRPWVEAPRFDEGTVEDDLVRISDFYRSLGYYNARAEYTLLWNEKRTRVDLHFSVAEGQPVLLTSFEILGLEGLQHAGAEEPVDRLGANGAQEPAEPEGSEQAVRSRQSALSADLPLTVGGVFRASHYVDSKNELLLRLANRGFPEAQLEGGGEVDVEALSARIHWTVDPGPFVRLGDVRVVGLEGVAKNLVLRELVIAAGDPYSQAELRASELAIYQLGLFLSVVVKALKPEGSVEAGGAEFPAAGAAVWPVEVRVRERPPRSVRIAVGYGTEDEFRARTTLLQRNFLGGARTLSVSGKYSSLVLGVGSRFIQPRFLDPHTELEVDLSFLRETPPAYDSNLVVARAVLRRPVGELWTVRAGYFFERGDVTRVESGDPREEGVSLLSFLELGVRRSSVDDLLDAKRGSYFDFSLEPAFKFLGSDVNYLKLESVAHWFQPLWSRFEWMPVLAVRVHAGVIQPFSGSQTADVPVFRRFYSGGANTVRGFEYQSLGPVDAQGEPQGGLTVTELNIELRFPIWRVLSGVIFSDTGQVAREPFNLRFEDFRTSLGGGVRIKTPLGPLRFDYGRLLNPPPNTARGQFYISIGQAF